MSQNKISILSTRLLNDEFIRDAKAKEIWIEVSPFVKTAPVSSVDLQKKIQEGLSTPFAIVFTSANAVDAIASEIKDEKPQAKIFCIGYATRRSVEKRFGTGSIQGTADNAKELAEKIREANVAEVTFFCGDQRRDELPDQLKKNNIQVTEIVVYNTILTPQKIGKKYNGILFCSPSAVKSFFQVNQLNDETVLFTIGHTTAHEIKKFTKNKIVVSDMPDINSLLDKVISYFQTFTHH